MDDLTLLLLDSSSMEKVSLTVVAKAIMIGSLSSLLGGLVIDQKNVDCSWHDCHNIFKSKYNLSFSLRVS